MDVRCGVSLNLLAVPGLLGHGLKACLGGAVGGGQVGLEFSFLFSNGTIQKE